jgi:subtilisin-like proprotein convertase family protein
MKTSFFQRVARLGRLFRRRTTPRPAGRPRVRPMLEALEERALPSASVFRAVDVPRPVDFPDVFTTSSIDVPQNLTIANLKVQLDVTYPLDNDLTIDLIAPDGTDVPLSYFEGTGANFQNTTFDDGAATPISAGNSPFAGSYQPEWPLAALDGKNAQGVWQLQFIDYGDGSGTLNSWSLIIQPTGTPATASSLVGGGFPTSTTAGQTGGFTVTALDANGNVDAGYTGTVHFTSSDSQAGLPADYTFTAADAGSHTFGATLTTAGAQSLTATDTASDGLTGTEQGITVSPAAASRLVVSAPSGVTAGAAFPVTVTAQDAYGNTATGYGGVVHFSSSDGQAVLPVDSTLASGTGVFSVTLLTAGSQTLTVTDTASSTLTGNAFVSVSPTSSGALVFHSTDVPQTFNATNVYVASVINVPQNVTIGSIKVQINVTYPLDSDLQIDLQYYDNNGIPRAMLTLAYFVGNGANFQDTIFDDAAATPIAAGAPPFAGSYRPSNPLSAFVGQSAQGTWVLEVGNFVGGTGTLNSWSLIIQPAVSPNAAAGTSAHHHGTPVRVAASSPSPSPEPTNALPFAGMPTTGSVGSTAVETAGELLAFLLPLPLPLTSQATGPAGAIPSGSAATPTGAEQVVVRSGAGLDAPSASHVRDGQRKDPVGINGAGVFVNGIEDDVVL